MTVHTFDGYTGDAWLQLHWTAEDVAAARKEDWAIWSCDGGWCIDSYDIEKGEENDPWLKVRTGTGAHHSKARAFIEHYSPAEWEALNDWFQEYGRS